jgi:hypothetical protein
MKEDFIELTFFSLFAILMFIEMALNPTPLTYIFAGLAWFSHKIYILTILLDNHREYTR